MVLVHPLDWYSSDTFPTLDADFSHLSKEGLDRHSAFLRYMSSKTIHDYIEDPKHIDGYYYHDRLEDLSDEHWNKFNQDLDRYGRFVSMDVENNINTKEVCLMILASPGFDIHVFQLGGSIDFPPRLKLLLEDESMTYIGSGIKKDFAELRLSTPTRVIEVSVLLDALGQYGFKNYVRKPFGAINFADTAYSSLGYMSYLMEGRDYKPFFDDGGKDYNIKAYVKRYGRYPPAYDTVPERKKLGYQFYDWPHPLDSESYGYVYNDGLTAIKTLFIVGNYIILKRREKYPLDDRRYLEVVIEEVTLKEGVHKERVDKCWTTGPRIPIPVHDYASEGSWGYANDPDPVVTLPEIAVALATPSQDLDINPVQVIIESEDVSRGDLKLQALPGASIILRGFKILDYGLREQFTTDTQTDVTEVKSAGVQTGTSAGVQTGTSAGVQTGTSAGVQTGTKDTRVFFKSVPITGPTPSTPPASASPTPISDALLNKFSMCQFPPMTCSVCGSKHEIKKCKYYTDQVKLTGTTSMKHWGNKGQRLCNYPRCNTPYTHIIYRCMALGSRCGLCGLRGHYPGDDCKAPYVELESDFEQFRKGHMIMRDKKYKFEAPKDFEVNPNVRVHEHRPSGSGPPPPTSGPSAPKRHLDSEESDEQSRKRTR